MPKNRKVVPRVQLVEYTKNAKQVIASAAKLCYASNTDTILEQPDNEKTNGFLNMLKDMGHLSTFEHISFTFYIEGVSRAMTHQLVRHRIASYSQRSQRYVKESDFNYVVPGSFVGKTVTVNGEEIDAVEFYDSTMSEIGSRYEILLDALGNNGEKSNQDARYILPNACETKIFVTMNLRTLFHFFGERLCMRAQWEIREVAEKMLSLVKEVYPELFKNIGPKCVQQNGCPEGKMTCGKYIEQKEKYGN